MSHRLINFFLETFPKGIGCLMVIYMGHSCFKQAQPKMCHSPKVEDGVDIFIVYFFDSYFWTIFFKELETAINPKPLELLT